MPARDCRLTCDFDPDARGAYLCTGDCGERVSFGVSVVLTDAEVPPNACASFRDALLRTFGAGGTRRLSPENEPVLPDALWQHLRGGGRVDFGRGF